MNILRSNQINPTMFSNPDWITSGHVLRVCVFMCACVCSRVRAEFIGVCILAPFLRGASSLILRSSPSSWEPPPGAPPKQAYL